MKYFIIIGLISSLFVTSRCSASSRYRVRSNIKGQDSLWNPLYDILKLDGELYKKQDILTHEEFNILHEHYLRLLREKGLIYWNTSTDINQRREWLLLTLTVPPNYYDFSDEKFDRRQKEKWDSAYRSLKKDFLTSLNNVAPRLRGILKRRLGIAEIYGSLEHDKFLFYVKGKKTDPNNYVTPIIGLAKEAGSDSLSVLLTVKQTADVLFNGYQNFGLYKGDVLSFLNKLDSAHIPALSKWVEGKKKILELKDISFSLKFKTYDNRQIDISQMWGKVILIDFWATWCSVCLEYMPTVKKVFEKYHNRGFEVLSLSINKNSEMQQVIKTEKRMNVSWPLGIIGDEKLKNDIWKKFGFTSVPQLMLLDKKGKLIEINGKLMNPEALDKLVNEALSNN